MKTNFYSDEINVQILVAILKAHNIRKIIASPGTTNMSFVHSVQNDDFFEVFSSVDERSAAYIATGLSIESGEPVVITCTGATASRNYLPGLTEAFYRKIPILAVTATQEFYKVGQNVAQVIDRSNVPKDAIKKSVFLDLVKDENDFMNCEFQANEALLALYRDGGGPVHINLSTNYNNSFTVQDLPNVKIMNRYYSYSKFPTLSNKRIAIHIGSHKRFSENETRLIDDFCEKYDAVVFVDHTSGYHGKYAVHHAIVASQRIGVVSELVPDILIQFGEITGDYSTAGILGKEIWRVNEDGELKDSYRKLTNMFATSELVFLKKYLGEDELPLTGSMDRKSDFYLSQWQNVIDESRLKMNNFALPFSNIWMAREMHDKIPENSVIHFGILNSLRSWNLFELPDTVESYSNVGGFGIDGNISSTIGASLYDHNKLYFLIIGDLAFFYDLNSLGNRHVGKNLRILLINNGVGTEFKNFNHRAAKFADDADEFTAARGHFGNKNPLLVKSYAENLGFEYFAASNEKEFAEKIDQFTNPKITNSMIFEVFTDSENESKALETVVSLNTDLVTKTKDSIRKVLGEDRLNKMKKLINR